MKVIYKGDNWSRFFKIYTVIDNYEHSYLGIGDEGILTRLPKDDCEIWEGTAKAAN